VTKTALPRALFDRASSKVRWLFRLIYGSVPAEFESAFDIDESVKRLSAVTRSWFAIWISGPVTQGEVAKDFV
jgi:hypothetical protein